MFLFSIWKISKFRLFFFQEIFQKKLFGRFLRLTQNFCNKIVFACDRAGHVGLLL